MKARYRKLYIGMNVKYRKYYLEHIWLNPAEIEEFFDVIDVSCVSNQYKIIEYFNNHFNNTKVQLMNHSFIMKVGSSDNRVMYLLVRKIKGTELFQIDVYHEDIDYFANNLHLVCMPIVTIVFENNFSKNVKTTLYTPSHFDYMFGPYHDEIMSSKKFRDSEIVAFKNNFFDIALLVASTAYSISQSHSSDGYYGYFPKMATLLDGQMHITTKKENFRRATIIG